MLDIYEVQIFLAAAETGSFSEAGRRLQLSQPAVSMQIRSLEKRLGVPMFHRSGRHIRLTDAGKALIPMARELVNLSIHAEEMIASLQGEVIGTLLLACSTTAGKYVLPRLMAVFMQRYPQVQIECAVVSRGEALEMLLSGEAHLAVTSLREASRHLEFRQFVLDPVILIAPPGHPWAAQGTITVQELTDGRFILRELDSGTHQAVDTALSEHNVNLSNLDVVMTMGNSEAIQLAVAEGIGAAFVSRYAAMAGLAAGSVVEVSVEGLEIFQQLFMSRHANRIATTAQAAFWEHAYAPENRALFEYTIGSVSSGGN